jgi:hypothetical protein
MKRILISIFILLGLLTPAVALRQASAIDLFQPTGSTSACNNTAAAAKPDICKDDSAGAKENPIIGPNGILTVIIKILSLIVGVISVIIIVVSGMRMVLSGSDANTAAGARRGVVYSAVGLVIAAIAQGIVALVLSKL